MKIGTLIVSTIALVFVAGSPAEAKSTKKVRHAAVNHEQMVTSQQPGFQGGVMKGPLYNGPDYLGDDPDPNIRAYLIKDKTRYIGSF